MFHERARIYLFLAWSLVAGIIVISLLPGTSLPPLNWQHLISIDKIGHFLSYGLTAWLFYQHRLLKNYKQSLASIGLALFTLGIFLELMQNNLENGRHFDVLDIIANGLGVLIAGLISTTFK